jgi:hypothetical protein
MKDHLHVASLRAPRLYPLLRRDPMSCRQGERWSRFQVEIEEGVRVAAAACRDNDPEASSGAAIRLRGRRFAQLVHQARELTQARISLSVVAL